MPGGNQDFPFRIEVTYGDGDTKAYFTHSLATDVENVVSASIMNGKIDNMPQATIIGDSGSAVSGGYLTQETNGPIPLGGRTTGMFGDHDVGVNSALSISFDDPATGSLTFHDTETTDKGGLASYQFFGTKVCSVLGVPEAIPIRTENFKLSDDSTDTSNYISGDIISDSIAIKEGFKMSPQARMKSNMVWDTENGEGLTQWVSGSSVLLQMGISGSTSNTKLSGDGNLQITGVDELTFAGGSGKIIGADSLEGTELIFDSAADVTILSGRSSYDETVHNKGQLKIDTTGDNVLTGQLRINDTESTTFSNTVAYGDYTLMLRNSHGDAVGDFVGIGFDAGTTQDADAIAGSIVVARDNTTTGAHDGNMIFSTNDAGEDGNTERMRITHDGIVEIAGDLDVDGTTNLDAVDIDGAVNINGDVTFVDAGSTDTIVKIHDSNDDGLIDVYANNSVKIRLHGNGHSYFNAGDVSIGGTVDDDDSLARLTVYQNDANFVASFVNSTNNTAADGIMVNYTGNSSLGSSAKFIQVRDSGNDVQYEVKGNSSDGSTVVTSFTAGHDTACLDDNDLMPGLIIESTGEVWHKPSASFETALPFTQLSNSNGSNKVFGVIDGVPLQYDATGSIVNADKGEQYVKNGYYMPPAFTGYSNHAPTGSANRQLNTMSLGEGVMWVTNHNGNIENGDYIESSVIKGYGRKQDDDILRSKTVAKCTEAINWTEVTSSIQYSGSAYKKYLTAVTFHCG